MSYQETALLNDELANRAQVLVKEVEKTFLDQSASAEDIEQAERKMKEAESMIDRSKRLAALKDNTKAIVKTDVNAPDKKGDTNNPPEEFKTWGEFMLAIKVAAKGGNRDPRLTWEKGEKGSGFVAKDMAGNIGASGGFLAPKERRAGIFALQSEQSFVQSRATVIPMNTKEIEMVALKQSATTSGVTHYFGGIEVYYEGEAGTIDDSEPQFRTIGLRAYDLTALVYVPNQLLDDSPTSIDAWLQGQMGIGGALAHRADYAFMRGTGSGQPLGVLNAACTKSVTRTTGSTIKYDDLVKVLAGSMPSANRVWVAHTGLRETLMLMNGPSGNPSYLWGDAVNGHPERLLGYPIIFSEKVPALGSKGDIGLYDFSYYLVGDRQSLLFDESTHVRFARNMTGYKAIARHDGQPWLDAVFTLMDGTTSISPFVVVAA
jgi:HK97 family phage major capsid protein